MNSVGPEHDPRISEATRRNIFDYLRLEGIPWYGRMGDNDFLSRIWNLERMPSYDPRYDTASRDITQHRVFNDDWEDDWIFSDARFDLFHCEDETFLAFLSATVHPLARPDTEQARAMVEVYNESLAADGWELAEVSRVAGRPVFDGQHLLMGSEIAIDAIQAVADDVGTPYINRQVGRMRNAINDDPDLAIGTAKEFVETIAKAILSDRGESYDAGEDYPTLIRRVIRLLELAPENIPDHAQAAETIKRLLQNFATIVRNMAELRNPYGTGHGRDPHRQGLQPRHARLAVGAAATLGVFLYETHRGRDLE